MTNPATTPAAILVTSSTELTRCITTIAAACGAELRHQVGLDPTATWPPGAVVLLDATWACRLAQRRDALPAHVDIIVVCETPPDESTWAAALAARARAVLRVPHDTENLATHFIRQRSNHHRGRLIAVMAGSANAPAADFALALAHESAHLLRDAADTPAVVVDADTTFAEPTTRAGLGALGGMRWSDLPDAGVALDGALLAQALPRCGNVPILGFPTTHPTRAQSTDVHANAIAALADAASVAVVFHAASSPPPWKAPDALPDRAVLVVDDTRWAVEQAQRIHHRVTDWAPTHLVLSGGRRPTAHAPATATTLEAHAVTRWRPDRRLAADAPLVDRRSYGHATRRAARHVARWCCADTADTQARR